MFTKLIFSFYFLDRHNKYVWTQRYKAQKAEPLCQCVQKWGHGHCGHVNIFFYFVRIAHHLVLPEAFDDFASSFE